MLQKIKSIIKKISRKIGIDIKKVNPSIYFHSNQYLRITSRRLEHLASLNIPVSKKTVLEVGAGIGDHSHYYIDRDCKITITDARNENLKYLKSRYPEIDIKYFDLDQPHPIKESPFDIIHCYGILYHLGNPGNAIKFLSRCCKKMLFLETVVSYGDSYEVNLIEEDQKVPTHAFSGIGCRPTRVWVFHKLKEFFEFVYIPKTQPNHEQFPLNWTKSEKSEDYHSRSIFIASREKINNLLLSTSLLDHQIRQE